MRTLNIQAKITRKDPIIHLNLKDVVPDGEYQVLVVIESIKNALKQPLKFRTTDAAIDPGLNFGRDEIYGNDGR
jgi:hypothetical protein